MKELFNHYDIFTLPNNNAKENIVCVTTNGIIKKNGHAVMGAGIAKTANERFHVSKKLAEYICTYGNVPCFLGQFQYKTSQFYLCSFPTKNDWRDPSDLELIKRSAQRMTIMADAEDFQHIYMTPPGCGCGGLDYETQVKPILEPILDDRFVIVFRGKTY